MQRTRSSVVLWIALLWAALAWPVRHAAEFTTRLKSRYSNPVLPVVIEQRRAVNLILTTDIDGIMICADPPNSTITMPSRIDYDYARKLLQDQLAGMLSTFAVVQLSIPSLQVDSLQMPVRMFYVQDQDRSPTALNYFLRESNATGFIGVGYAFRRTDSLYWHLLEKSVQYRITSNLVANTSTTAKSYAAVLSGSDFVAGQLASEQNELDWSEPLASVDQADDVNRNNNQGLSFPIHHPTFQCGSTPSSRERTVKVLGTFSSSWDVTIDLNTPCLVLPQQFYSALAGWVGLEYNETAKLSQFAANKRLPSLQFTLTHDGPVHSLDLQALALNTTATSSSQSSWVCIDKAASIVHNGASVFTPIDTESATVQRYRLHGSMILPVYNMQQVPIAFGTTVLAALGAFIVDGEAKQVALPYLDKDDTTIPTVAACLPSPTCLGQQWFDDRLNACVDPDCSVYYFHAMDPDTKECVVDADYTAFVWTSVTILVAAEVLCSQFIQHTVKTASMQASDE